MSDSPSTVLIYIMGKEYQIACPPEEKERLLEAAQYLDDKMREIKSTGKVIGLERIAIMSALNLSHELLANRADTSAKVTGSSEQVTRINNKLDAALQRLKQLEI